MDKEIRRELRSVDTFFNELAGRTTVRNPDAYSAAIIRKNKWTGERIAIGEREQKRSTR